MHSGSQKLIHSHLQRCTLFKLRYMCVHMYSHNHHCCIIAIGFSQSFCLDFFCCCCKILLRQCLDHHVVKYLFTMKCHPVFLGSKLFFYFVFSKTVVLFFCVRPYCLRLESTCVKGLKISTANFASLGNV